MRSRTNGSEATREAQATIVETTQMLKETASDLTHKAQEYAREAGRQASAAAQNVYGHGNETLDVVENFARENIWTALLLAGAVGYGLACIVKNAR